MTPEEVDCLSWHLKTLKRDLEKVEPITELIATWLLSAVHAIKAGVWEVSPLFGFREAPSTGWIPTRYHVNPSPDIMARSARKFIDFHWRTSSPLFEDAARIVSELSQRWPTSFRQWTSHELVLLTDELGRIPHPPFELPKDAEKKAQFDEAKARYLSELVRLERLECERMEAGELIAGSEQLPWRGTHLHRFTEIVREAGTLGAQGNYLRFKAQVRNEFAGYIETLIRLHKGGKALSLGHPSHNAVRSAETAERLLKVIFGDGNG